VVISKNINNGYLFCFHLNLLRKSIRAKDGEWHFDKISKQIYNETVLIYLKGDRKRNFTFWSKYNVTNNYFIPYQMNYHTQNNSNHQLSYFINMFLKSLISELSWAIARVYYTR